MYDVVMQSNGRNKLIPSHFEYEFCDDLWRHIKSFIKRPVYVERGLALIRQKYYNLGIIIIQDLFQQIICKELIDDYNYIINRTKPYKSEDGGYVLFNGQFIHHNTFEIRQKYFKQTRQEIIDKATKEIMSKILVASITR